MLQFLEDHENAFMNIEYVLRSNPMTGATTTLCTDEGKRRLFVTNFTHPDHTAEMIDSVEATTTTWDAMVNALRRRIAKRRIRDLKTASVHAKQAIVEPSPSPIDVPDSAFSMDALINHLSTASPTQFEALINALSTDWHVGIKLWKSLTDKLRKQVAATCRQNMSSDSGEETGNPKPF